MTERKGKSNLKTGKGGAWAMGAEGLWGGRSWCAGVEGVGVGGRRAENLGLKGPFTGIHKCNMP